MLQQSKCLYMGSKFRKLGVLYHWHWLDRVDLNQFPSFQFSQTNFCQVDTNFKNPITLIYNSTYCGDSICFPDKFKRILSHHDDCSEIAKYQQEFLENSSFPLLTWNPAQTLKKRSKVNNSFCFDSFKYYLTKFIL